MQVQRIDTARTTKSYECKAFDVPAGVYHVGSLLTGLQRDSPNDDLMDELRQRDPTELMRWLREEDTGDGSRAHAHSTARGRQNLNMIGDMPVAHGGPSDDDESPEPPPAPRPPRWAGAYAPPELINSHRPPSAIPFGDTARAHEETARAAVASFLADDASSDEVVAFSGPPGNSRGGARRDTASAETSAWLRRAIDATQAGYADDPVVNGLIYSLGQRQVKRSSQSAVRAALRMACGTTREEARALEGACTRTLDRWLPLHSLLNCIAERDECMVIVCVCDGTWSPERGRSPRP